MIARYSTNAGKLAENVHHHVFCKSKDSHTTWIPDNIFFSLNEKFVIFTTYGIKITAREILAIHSSSESPIFKLTIKFYQ